MFIVGSINFMFIFMDPININFNYVLIILFCTGFLNILTMVYFNSLPEMLGNIDFRVYLKKNISKNQI